MAQALIDLYNKGNLSPFLLREIRNTKKRVQDVQRKLDLWYPVLKDLDAIKSKSSTVHHLEREIRDIVYRIQNVRETYSNEDKPRRGRSIIRKFIDDFKFFRMVDLDVKEINRLIKENILYLISALALSMKEKGSQSENENKEIEIPQMLRRSISDSRENDDVGMDDKLETLKSALLEGNDPVICIYGTRGIGKTALAHKLYSNPFIQSNFQIRHAAEIGRDFDARNVLEGILAKLPEEKEITKQTDLTTGKLAEHFNKYAKDMRYLFVLDDIRSLEDWEFLREAFPNNQKGSKVMLTTRSVEVAICVYGYDDGHVHVMQPLTETDSLELFRKTSFSWHPDRTEDVSLQDNITHKVLKCCASIPSAIVAVREVLAPKQTSHDWEMVFQDINLLIERNLPVEQIVLQNSVSALFFDGLPFHLKPCFLYLGLFPKDSKIEMENLYLQWMAEGMIARDDSQKNEKMMDFAERCLSDLEQKKMVEVEEEEISSLRKHKSCWVHELMHDQCLRQGQEYFFKVLDKRSSDPPSSTTNRARRMALHLGMEDDSSSVNQLTNEKVDHLRSLLVLNPQDLQIKLEWHRRMFNLKKYRMLRILYFERVDFQKRGLPRGMKWPIYLRYLSFKECILWVLPSSIGSLSFLETLDLRVSSQIIIPNVLRKLGKLVYLYLPLEFKTPNNHKLYLKSLKEIEILENFHTGMCNVADLFKMMRLRHLSTTVEGNLADLKQIVCRMGMTSENTSVSIKVKNLDCYTEERHSVFRELLRCQILHTLHMDGHLGQIPPRYEITTRLTEMVLKGSQLKEDPMMTLDKLPELQVLVLQNDAFDGKKMVCVESSFMKLKRLELLTLRFLETWEVEEGSMPVLSILAVKNCGKLRTLPDELKNRFFQSHLKLLVGLYP